MSTTSPIVTLALPLQPTDHMQGATGQQSLAQLGFRRPPGYGAQTSPG